MTGQVYRGGDGRPPQFVCIACYRTASVDEPGMCSLCGAPRLPLDREEVRKEVRRHIEQARQRASRRRVVFAFVGFSLLSILIYGALGFAGVIDLHRPHRFRHLPINELVFVPIWLICVFGGTFVTELRLRSQRGMLDLASAGASELLQSLGVRVE